MSEEIALVDGAAARGWMLRKRLDKLRLKYAFLASLVLAAATWLLAGILGGGLWWLFGWFLALSIFVLALASGGQRDSSARNLGRDVSRATGSGELGSARGFECVEGAAGHSPTMAGLAFRAAHVRATPYAPASFRIQGGIAAKLNTRTAAAKRARNKPLPGLHPMCGIIGIIGKAPVAPLLVEALKRLEYRGYDSAGVATLVNGHIDRRRAEGKLVNLEARLGAEPLSGTIGIGHTRWATHGKPSERNAHPIATDWVAIVHNGIIENFQELKDELVAEGRRFESDTDTEVVAQLLTSHLERQMSPEEAMGKAMERLRGAFALVALFSGRHDILMGARRGSSLAVGYGDGEMYIGTDALALAPFTKRVTYLEDDDWVVLNAGGATIFQGRKEVKREIRQSGISGAMMGKGNHRHFMLKEIYEQPAVVGDTLQTYLDPTTRSVSLPALPFDWNKVSRVTMTACGTAFYACMVGKYWFEKLARLPVEIEVASELRYREPPLPEGGVCIAVSQSGETVDTLAALRYAKAHQQTILSVVNVPESAIARESHVVLPTLAGPEIGVASTKAFTTQLTVLLAAAMAAGRARGVLSEGEEARLAHALIELPARVNEALNMEEQYRRIAEDILAEARDVLYMGRGSSFPIALEGALKLKEISYIHAEGYAGGEMKHGPIALIDESVPVVVVAPTDAIFDKIASNFEQVKARGGKLVLLSDAAGNARLGGHAVAAITLPTVDPVVAPILYAVPVQMLAYYTAVANGTDVDQPRNLAKSVTVE